MLRIIAVLLLIPLLDVMLLAAVAQFWLGWVLTVAVVVLTGLVGLLLVRAEGRRTIRKIQRTLAQGEVPTDELIDGGLLIAAGAFFLTPGLVTDGLALLMVLPPSRWPIRAGLKRWIITPYVDAKTGGFATGQVYVGGFPPEDGHGGAGAGAQGGNGPTGPGTGGDAGAGAVDSDDVVDVEFDERD
jgi:UPF0716 protein FxsA